MSEQCEWTEVGVVGGRLQWHEPCAWMEVADSGWNYWETGCDEAFIFYEGTPTSNKYRYCPYCGRPIQQTEIRTEEPDATDDAPGR